jgi:hypothetical protein
MIPRDATKEQIQRFSSAETPIVKFTPETLNVVNFYGIPSIDGR